MKDLLISRADFSPFFWELIGTTDKPLPRSLDALEGLRTKADYNTGSLSYLDCVDVHALASYFKPTSVAEVGTFIGRSTHSLAAGMDEGEIWTCDSSNALNLPEPENQSVKIKQFRKTNSTDMFAKAMTLGFRFDLFYIDGRLTERDVELMSECIAFDGSVIVLDDFEGVEKGVANSSILLNWSARNAKNYTLIYPQPGRKTAVLVPFNRIRFVPQV